MVGLRHATLSGLFLAGGTAIQVAVAFGANLVLARHLDPADFGRFAVVQAGAGLYLALTSLRIGTQIVSTPEAELTPDLRQRLLSVLTIETGLAALVIAGWLALGGLWQPRDLALAFAVLLVHWTSHNRTFFERSMPYGRLAVVETGTSVIGHLLAVGLVLAGAGAETLYVRELFFAVFGLAALARVGGISLCRLRWPAWWEWREVVRHARGIWADSMLEGSFQRLVLLVVSGVGGLAGAGLFYQAHRLALVPQQFLQPITSRVLFVWLARQEDDSVRRAGCVRMLLILALPLGLAGLAAWAWADPVVPWVFGPAWAQAAPLLAALCGMIAATMLFELLRSYAFAARRGRLLLPARLMQYGAFLLPLAPLLWHAPVTAERVAWALSAAHVAALAALALLVLRRRRRAA